jgi:hypothetical protein
MRCRHAGGFAVAFFAVVACASSPTQQNQVVPSPRPAAVTITGHSDQVTSPSPFHLDARAYRVSWNAQGQDNFVVTIVSATQFEPLLNETPPQPASGEVKFQADGGDYHLVVAVSTLTWKITFTPI